ncbi:MAG: hypothetical protein K6A65_04185 [Succinivibrionaceae bacterium]|nr:hypothetical protein [Succinivibrionaceae bacterium]
MAESSNQRLEALFKEIGARDPGNELLAGIYRRHGVDGDAAALVMEIRKDGSSTLKWPITGPVDYDEVVDDVAARLKVPAEAREGRGEEEVELLVLSQVVRRYLEDLPDAERAELIRDIEPTLRGEHLDQARYFLKGGSVALLSLVQAMGMQALRQLLLRVVAGMTAGTAASLAASRLAALLVPGINALMALWLVTDIAGPAYRKTVPTVINIAALRLLLDAEARA